MPLLIYLVVAWIGGLLAAALLHAAAGGTGAGASGRSLVLVFAAIVVVAVFASLLSSDTVRDRPVHAGLAAVAIAGVLAGDASARRTVSCRAALAREAVLHVAIDDRIAAGGHSNGVARLRERAGVPAALHACRARVSLRATDGSGRPGEIVEATGAFRTTNRGLRGEAAIASIGRTDAMRAIRGRTGETIDTLFRANAPLVRALLIADQDGIPPAVRDRFADAGLVHMLSISGLHVAIIASALLVLASAMQIPRNTATVAALAVVCAYVLVLGAPPPAVRSAVMLATLSLSERMQRPVHAWTALALGALIPTVDPSVVLDLGYQLSVSGMAALVASRALLRRVRHAPVSVRRSARDQAAGPVAERIVSISRACVRAARGLRGWKWQLARECATGVIATVVTMPLIAWTFGRVSIIAPLSNIVAGPVVAFLQPALFLALVLQPWPMAARFAAGATAAPLALLDRIAATSAAVPFASVHVTPTLFTALCAGIASAAFVRATAARRMVPGLVVGGFALAAAVWAPLVAAGPGRLELHMLDVGQGDAFALRTPGGRWILVDAGRRWDGGDAGRRTVVPYVQRRGGRVAAFVLSHAHDDHAGGAESIVAAVRPQRWWEPAFVTTSAGYRNALAAARAGGVTWERVRPGRTLEIDGVRVQVLAPDSAWTAAQRDANETSVVLRVGFGRVAFLLTGDAEAHEEEWLLRHTEPELLRADVLKLGHHGSRTSSTPAFVDAVAPRLGLVSVGAGNRYGHPSPETLATFAARAVPLLRTDRDGAVVISTDGRELLVSAGGHRWKLPPR